MDGKPVLSCLALALFASPAGGALRGDDGEPRRLLLKDGIQVRLDEAYILEGRIKVERGEAWLRVDLPSAGGALARHETPRVQPGSDWTFVAVETAADAAVPDPDSSLARIELCVLGEAASEAVRLEPLSPVIFSNGGMEAPLDRKGRVALWSEEKDESILAGKREGTHALEASGPRSGKACLSVVAAGDWCAASSVNYPIPAWSDRYQIVAAARSGEGIEAQLVAIWSDDGPRRILRVDRSPSLSGPAWQRLATDPIEPPPEARLLRVALVARRGSALDLDRDSDPARRTAWFDDVDIVTLPARARTVKVVVNQVGYELKAPKSAIVLTNFFPRDAALGAFEVVDGEGKAVIQGPLPCSGRMRGEKSADWGWYFWRADFSALEREGSFRVRARVAGAEGESFSFQLGRDLLFRETVPLVVDFFFVQRCGFDVPGWHRACHLDDAKLPDGTHRDLTGGWHSAGDYNKIAWEYGDGGATYALSLAAAAAPEVLSSFDRDRDGLPDVLDEAWWGARYLAKIEGAGASGFLGHIQQGPDRQSWMRWVPPESQTDNVPGTADDPIVLEADGQSPLAMGGWARLGALLERRGAPNDHSARATRLWERLAGRPGAESDPLLLLSTLEIWRATRDERLRTFAEKCVDRFLKPDGGSVTGALRGGYGDSGDIPAAALALFALELPGEARDSRTAAIRGKLERHLDSILAETRNPIRLTMQKASRGSEEGHFFEPSSVYGQNFLFGCRAWSALSIYRVLGDRRALEYAVDQLDFLLGKNPYNLCMLEGRGSLNPPRYHHRYDSILGRERGAVPGAIPNGFVRDVGSHDRPGFDLSAAGRDHPSYRTNEPWLVHDVFYLLAMTALHEALQ